MYFSLWHPSLQAIALETSKPAWDRLTPLAEAMSVDASYTGPHLPPMPPVGSPIVSDDALMKDENLVNEHGISLG